MLVQKEGDVFWKQCTWLSDPGAPPRPRRWGHRDAPRCWKRLGVRKMGYCVKYRFINALIRRWSWWVSFVIVTRVLIFCTVCNSPLMKVGANSLVVPQLNVGGDRSLGPQVNWAYVQHTGGSGRMVYCAVEHSKLFLPYQNRMITASNLASPRRKARLSWLAKYPD